MPDQPEAIRVKVGAAPVGDCLVWHLGPAEVWIPLLAAEQVARDTLRLARAQKRHNAARGLSPDGIKR